ncbi:MAG: acyl-CoA dehydrogenase [Proteobacteria bacterium]|nr:MAG: acyl-CoA dehydrogenase [Pseudomonadota bacterium]
MPIYQAPLRDMRFVIHELFGAEHLLNALPGFEELSADLIDAVLEEAGKLAEGLLLPLNQTGDEQGCRYERGAVTTPEGFKQAYQTFIESGWNGLGCDPRYGGQGLPAILEFMVEEMWCAANVAFSLYPVLTNGAYRALAAHASDELKQRFLPAMVEGRWTGTMCLTEPHSGTDLGLIRTKAEVAADGSYRITGSKIFITGGEQDLTENIIHLVLARLPDAPPGIKGISLFIVPKFKLNAASQPGESNGVHCGSIEHKMGIKGAATCVINFDNAEGFLVGAPGKGMACMFTMMNTERLAIGLQGLGLAEIAYQNAVVYARERLQGRAPEGPRYPEKPADPIIVHADVRRMLLTVRAYNEGCRALAGWVALQIDRAHRHPEPSERERADDLVALLTPIVKAFFSDLGFENCNQMLQVYGGHGYIREWGMEQYVRDARIAQIYEGTNGVQAMDLVRRKLFLHGGRLATRFFDMVSEFVEQERGTTGMEPYLIPLESALNRLRDVTRLIVQRNAADPNEPGAAAVDYLRLFGLVALGYMWSQSARVALEQVGGAEADFYRAKLATARFYFQRLLPATGALSETIKAGSEAVMELDEAAF